MAATKIATCCYCGTKAALVLRGKERHELTCDNCGAPLHAFKMLPIEPERPRKPAATSPKSHRDKRAEKPKSWERKKPKKRKKNKSFGRKALSEIWDVIEDVFD